MDDYKRGYEQALKDINTSMSVITENCNPSECPRCGEVFSDYEPCDDDYYDRATYLERCPYCGQKLLLGLRKKDFHEIIER